jgi:hypothetical protein
VVLTLKYGSNSVAEVKPVLLLIELAVERGCRDVQFFGNPQLVINWISGTSRQPNLGLEHLIRQDLEHLSGLGHVSCSHIYQEVNITADGLSKRAAHALIVLL